jgi:type II secretory pathway component GspD/PulD (secretin)
LLTDKKSKTVSGIPILKDIPILGLLFQKRSDEIEKVDLLIFITAHIVKEGEFSPEEIQKLEKRLDRKKSIKN